MHQQITCEYVQRSEINELFLVSLVDKWGKACSRRRNVCVTFTCECIIIIVKKMSKHKGDVETWEQISTINTIRKTLYEQA